MSKDIIDYAKTRHAIKAYDGSQNIDSENVAKLKTLLRLSPSSMNIQPWNFIWASSKAGKQRVAKAAAAESFLYNQSSILNASHVVIFAGLIDAPDAHLKCVVDQEHADGRYEAGSETETLRRKNDRFAAHKNVRNLHKNILKDESTWLSNQLYLNLGQFLLGAAALGVGATPMEGIDTSILDTEFGLSDKGYRSFAIVTLGYADMRIWKITIMVRYQNLACLWTIFSQRCESESSRDNDWSGILYFDGPLAIRLPVCGSLTIAGSRLRSK